MLAPWKNSYLPLRDLDKAKPANKRNSIAYNKDSILKSKDITFLTKVCLVKAMIFFSCHVRMRELDYNES